jgi:hypothetical protein
MSSANSPDNNCQGGVCETNFKPVRQAKSSFESLKVVAGDILTKVKETLTGEHDVIEESDQDGERNRLARMQQQTVHEKTITAPDAHVSMFSAEIIDRFKQNSWNPQAGTFQPVPGQDGFRALAVKPSKAAEGQLKAGRYDNPWRYDNRH